MVRELPDLLLRPTPDAARALLRRSAGALRLVQAQSLAVCRASPRLPALRLHHPGSEGIAMTAKPVVIIGIGDFGRIARFYLEYDSPHRVVAHAVSAAML